MPEFQEPLYQVVGITIPDDIDKNSHIALQDTQRGQILEMVVRRDVARRLKMYERVTLLIRREGGGVVN